MNVFKAYLMFVCFLLLLVISLAHMWKINGSEKRGRVRQSGFSIFVFVFANDSQKFSRQISHSHSDRLNEKASVPACSRKMRHLWNFSTRRRLCSFRRGWNHSIAKEVSYLGREKNVRFSVIDINQRLQNSTPLSEQKIFVQVSVPHDYSSGFNFGPSGNPFEFAVLVTKMPEDFAVEMPKFGNNESRKSKPVLINRVTSPSLTFEQHFDSTKHIRSRGSFRMIFAWLIN